MVLTEQDEKLLKKASIKVRGAKKDIELVLKNNSNSNKSRRQKPVDSDECTTEVPKS